jgi:hypothetical protein
MVDSLTLTVLPRQGITDRRGILQAERERSCTGPARTDASYYGGRVPQGKTAKKRLTINGLPMVTFNGYFPGIPLRHSLTLSLLGVHSKHVTHKQSPGVPFFSLSGISRINNSTYTSWSGLPFFLLSCAGHRPATSWWCCHHVHRTAVRPTVAA